MLFRSCDEPWDLGKGRSRARLPDGDCTEAYVQHVRRTHDFCAARGRRCQLWSDVIRNHPERLDRLPQNTTILHWGYDERTDYEGTATFVDAGLPTVVCPGTSGWKRIINAMDAAERNISTFAAVGRRCGAIGLINTDWGVWGHSNPSPCPWPARPEERP